MFPLLMAWQAAPDLPPPPRGPLRLSTAAPACADTADEVVVCARRPDRYRLPLPVERAADPDRRMAGDLPGGMAAITPAGRCGIFAGERRCGKAEARRYGYGAGRDPLSVLVKVGTTLLDSDAEVGGVAKR